MKTASRVLSLAGVLFFGCAALAAIRLAVADTLSHQGTPEAIMKAIAIEWPAPSAELEQMRTELDPAHAREALQRAVQANPRSSAAWIALGLLEEPNDLSAAEQSLRQAAQIDHQYLPAWTLANFYFRHANREQFWQWATRAAPLTYNDFKPLLQLCDQLEPDARRILGHFPDARRLRQPYLDFLIGENRLDAAQAVAQGILSDHANDPFLLDLADRQLRAGNSGAALELWNAASGFPSIEPSEGRILTNGDLRRAPLNLGFDWRVGQAQGVTQKWRPSELTLTLSGSQPEVCALLEQTIYLISRRFRLRFEYRSSDAASGLRWALNNDEGPPIETSAQWREGAFELPRANGLRDLKLFYRREVGTTRSQGRIEVRNLRLEAF